MIPKLRTTIFVGLAALSVTLLAACSTANAPVTVGLKTFGLTLSTTTVKAGDVTFNATNNAPDIQHEMILIKSDVPADQLKIATDGRIDEEAVEKVDEVSELDPGKSGTLTVKLAAGHYVLFCNIVGHYAQGMRADFTVTPN